MANHLPCRLSDQREYATLVGRPYLVDNLGLSAVPKLARREGVDVDRVNRRDIGLIFGSYANHVSKSVAHGGTAVTETHAGIEPSADDYAEDAHLVTFGVGIGIEL
jgi:hypothetical protein